MSMIVNPQKCPQNHPCPAIAVCPVKAISQQNNFSLPQINGELCIECGKCMRYCPMSAFEYAQNI